MNNHLQSSIPESIREIRLDFLWDVQKIWRLDLPVTVLPLHALEWLLDIPFLPTNGKDYTLTGREVIECPENYPVEFSRMMKADMRYPIELMEHKGRLVILDGLHRLMKAKREKKELIQTHIIPRSLIPEIQK